MSNVMSKQGTGNVNIDKLTIRLPAGWQGDPVYLARKISEQIQQQAADMQSTKSMTLSLQGHYSGVANRATEQFSSQLSKQLSQQLKVGKSNGGGRQ